MAIERLGILRLSAIGDVVHAMPLAMGLRRAFPGARISWVAQRSAAPLLVGHPAVDEVLVYPRRGGPRVWLDFLRRLRACRFDATVDPQGNLKSGVVGLLSGAAIRAGLARADCKERVNSLFTNRRGGPPRRSCPRVARCWRSRTTDPRKSCAITMSWAWRRRRSKRASATWPPISAPRACA